MHITPPVALHSARLTLRALDARDAPALFALYADAAVMRYWNHARWTTIAEAHAAIDEAQADYASGASAHYAIVRQADGLLLGSCALYACAPEHRSASIGYLLAQAHWGRGFASEAVRTLLADAFGARALRRIEAEVNAANAASAKALRALGFQQEADLFGHWIVGGQKIDTQSFALLRDDWLARTRTTHDRDRGAR